MADFRQMKWCPYKDTNSVPKLQLQPRISLILALDTNGRTFICLTQSNSNSSMMELFLRALRKKLDRERPDWDKNTVIMWDNAAYHTCPATLKILEALKMPTIFTAPHSYDASPCETWFAHFKSRDINPRHVKTEKK